MATSLVTNVEIPEQEREGLEQYGRVITGDFLILSPDMEYYNTIITNPPYSLAQQFVEKAFQLESKGARCQALNLLTYCK